MAPWRQVYSLALWNRIRRLLGGGLVKLLPLYKVSCTGCLYVCVCVCLGIYPEHACPGGKGVRAGGWGRGVGYPGLCLEQVSEVICHEEEEW